MHVASSTERPAHEKDPQGSLTVVNSSTTAAEQAKGHMVAGGLVDFGIGLFPAQ